MSKEKYFSVDVREECDNPILYHDTLEEAKLTCLNNARAAIEDAIDYEGYYDDSIIDFDNAIYGIVLGRAKLNIRPVTDEEKESGCFEEHIGHIIEPPVLVEANGWISVKEQMPKEFQTVLVFNSNIFIAELNGEGFVTQDEIDVKYVSHWQPLPEPPKE